VGGVVLADGQASDIGGRKAIHVFAWIDRSDDTCGIDPVRQWHLHQYSVYGGIGVQAPDLSQQRLLGQAIGMAQVEGAKPHFMRRIVLGGDIDAAGRIVPDQNHREPGRDVMVGFEFCRAAAAFPSMMRALMADFPMTREAIRFPLR
jgi:hypothetical protein